MGVRYLHVMSGLRGCYMPDSAFVIRVTSRKELRAALQYEADSQSCDGAMVGLSKAAVSWAANHAWKGAPQTILPFGRRGEASRPFCIELASATRREFLDYQENEGNF